MGQVILQVLGTAQDAGVPQPNCYCKNCTRAMEDPAWKRRAASLAVILPETRQWHLIDASPDFKEQLILLQRKFRLEGHVMDSILLTHAHIGHYPGLMYLGKEAMSTSGVSVYTGRMMKRMLETHAPWRQLKDLGNILLQELEDGKPVRLAEHFTVTPVDVPHRNEFSETFGFWIQGPKKRVLYIPDIDSWDEWGLDVIDACRKADICLLDATFFSSDDLADSGRSDRDLRDIPHPFITDSIARLKEIARETDIYFTHFNHSNPVLDPGSEARRFVETNGFHVAEEGMELEI
ncbi:coenzyme PQQ synthesis protein B [Sporosarcina sp. NCCP-2222]|uniref:MBL fold metallo-hydrolase n=1 Tax=Sporosarcina sp. NCCP-2222 TaxID=2935073 RepID=UPI00208AD665|nr:MBL fold metallo-hydrolase [Sporosarcina sp. NCCP-2222]GKV56690.1 coenzyme PQQ synthesis protein B [Sporosarcina sp. NCCP-2222]